VAGILLAFRVKGQSGFEVAHLRRLAVGSLRRRSSFPGIRIFAVVGAGNNVTDTSKTFGIQVA
jgi:hypothetical protein